MKNFKIIVESANKEIIVPGGSYKKALEDAGYFFPGSCNQQGTCLSCKIEFLKGAPPLKSIENESFGNNTSLRLACLHKIRQSGKIRIPQRNYSLNSKFINNFTIPANAKGFGIAVDLGTTQIAIYLINLEEGNIAATLSFLNTQNVYGSDVISRLQIAKNSEKRKNLTSLIRNSVISAISHICKQIEISRNEITKCFVTGNSVMTSFWLGSDAQGLSKIPFRSEFEGKGILLFESEMINLSPACDCRVSPIISGFVGGDTSTAILSMNLDRSDIGNRMLIDFGTNGEIALSVNGSLTVTSTAAGPAFEGVGMKSGLPAVEGAIEQFDSKGNPKVIGDITAQGICGSGYLSLVSYLLKAKIVNFSGLIQRDNSHNRTFEVNCKSNSPIVLTQDDVRSLQLAKAAINAGIEIVCNKAGISFDSIDEVILTGSFGYRIDPNDAIRVGLIPEIDIGKVRAIENAAGRGAILALTDKSYRDRLNSICRNSKAVNLGETDEFQELFVEKMRFSVYES